MSDVIDKGLKKIGVTISKPVMALLCIIFGILVIIFRDFLFIIVGIFLIIEGILMFTDYMEVKKQQETQSRTPQTNQS